MKEAAAKCFRSGFALFLAVALVGVALVGRAVAGRPFSLPPTLEFLIRDMIRGTGSGEKS